MTFAAKVYLRSYEIKFFQSLTPQRASDSLCLHSKTVGFYSWWGKDVKFSRRMQCHCQGFESFLKLVASLELFLCCWLTRLIELFCDGSVSSHYFGEQVFSASCRFTIFQ